MNNTVNIGFRGFAVYGFVVNVNLLIENSTYFEKMLKNYDHNSPSIILDSDFVTSDTFMLLLKYMNSNNNKRSCILEDIYDVKTAQKFIVAANYLGIQRVFDDKISNLGSLADVLIIAMVEGFQDKTRKLKDVLSALETANIIYTKNTLPASIKTCLTYNQNANTVIKPYNIITLLNPKSANFISHDYKISLLYSLNIPINNI